MQRKRSLAYNIFTALFALILGIMACGPSAATPTPVDESALRTSIAGTYIAEGNTPPPEATSPPDATAPSDATQVPGAPTFTPILHTTQPGEPTPLSYWLTDSSSASLAAERRANADNYTINLLERPFTSQVMDYQDYLDIVRGELDVQSAWVYVNVFVEGSPPQDSTAQYGVEIDLNLDGRGDWLIIGTVPNTSAWTTDGMTALQDPNGDVGGLDPMRIDAPNPAWNGYDSLVFDLSQGIGADPDAAWIRRHPSDNNVVQLAFKYTLIGSPSTFLWGVWADEGAQQPGWMDYHDHFTLAQAGSPASGSPDYPLKELASIDNSCRWSYNFTPSGNEVGLCYIPPTPTPTSPPPPTPLPPTPTNTPRPGTIRGTVWSDLVENGGIDSPNTRLSGKTIKLGQGNCPSSGYRSTTTNSSGVYIFSGLPAGTYCVTSTVSTSCSFYLSSASKNPDKVTVNAGQTKYLNFEYHQTVCIFQWIAPETPTIKIH